MKQSATKPTAKKGTGEFTWMCLEVSITNHWLLGQGFKILSVSKESSDDANSMNEESEENVPEISSSSKDLKW